jgi:hypothetical protein
VPSRCRDFSLRPKVDIGQYPTGVTDRPVSNGSSRQYFRAAPTPRHARGKDAAASFLPAAGSLCAGGAGFVTAMMATLAPVGSAESK